MNALDNLISEATTRAAAQRQEWHPNLPNAPQLLNATQAKALILVTVQTICTNCGRIWRSPNINALVRYSADGLTNSVKYSRAECAQYTHLPREHRTHNASAPYCEGCF